MRKPALVIIYNHRYVQNIEPLERLYADRFSRIFHLVPFYEGRQENVVPVYENSRFFQGYVAQGWRTLKSSGCDDFIFIGDDLLLNPIVNETTYGDTLGVNDETSFIPELLEFHRRGAYWPRCREAVEWPQAHHLRGLEVQGMLPAAHEAMADYARHGLTPQPLPAFLVDPRLRSDQAEGRRLLPLRYPLIGSYADIFAVPSSVMDAFAHFCGVFAATRLFVEVAIPSALAMASPRLVSEALLTLRGRALWTPGDLEILAPFGRSLSNLLSNFPTDCLYLHPIKLSQWKT